MVKPWLMLKLISTISIIYLLASCKAEKSAERITEPTISGEKMVAFLTFRFTINAKDSLNISLEDVLWSAGSLRDADEEISYTAFQFTFYDEKGNLVGTKYVEDPLNKEVEYVDENHTFKRKKVSLKDELLTMRLALPCNTVKVEIGDSFGRTIAKIELK
jgi:hypothetical protein